MQRRELGRSGIELSTLTFGSMRMRPATVGEDDAVDLLHSLLDSGVTSFHSSREYESYDYFRAVLRKTLRSRGPTPVQHIVKIAVPHFDEKRFSAAKFRARVDQELVALDAERLDVVQWLIRQTPNEDELRLPILKRAATELAECWAELKRAGKVGALTVFPYTIPFAAEALQLDLCDGLATYLNLLETESGSLLDAMLERGQGFLAIRPLLGGSLTGENTVPGHLREAVASLQITAEDFVAFCLSFPLLHPAVTSIVLSVSSKSHAEFAQSVVARAEVDQARFSDTIRALEAAKLSKVWLREAGRTQDSRQAAPTPAGAVKSEAGGNSQRDRPSE